ncbi:uncharacterized protein METZ01_LOCUS230741 [marine metagenome]|uniref:Uncharacterized protein n=1 Tax=marine metagenome TaxID=408172 RepID=A0A382GT89_9ZZZZ
MLITFENLLDGNYLTFRYAYTRIYQPLP